MVGSDIPVKLLPHCKKAHCGALLRPHIVWFGESLEHDILEAAGKYFFTVYNNLILINYLCCFLSIQ